MNSLNYITILREELVPALGCTEPISIAFGAATARAHLVGEPVCANLACSRGLIKNAKDVFVPNTNGMKGIASAVAIGLAGGDASKALEVLGKIGPDHIAQAKKYLADDIIKVRALDSQEKLHYILDLSDGLHTVTVEVKSHHTNIVRLAIDGRTMVSNDGFIADGESDVGHGEALTIRGILEFVERADIEELRQVLGLQIALNTAICEEGLNRRWGASVGKNSYGQATNLFGRIKARTAAGSDARMGGCSMPVVINSGSGNQGITVSVPVIEWAREHDVPEERVLRALALSNLIAIRQKSVIGQLSAYCGVVCAAGGAATAITWLSGGSLQDIERTLSNTLATISGMVCDGAKASCAGKIFVAVDAAFLGHTLAMEESAFIAGEGIVGNGIEQTIDNIGVLANEGMDVTDQVIVSLMLQNNN